MKGGEPDMNSNQSEKKKKNRSPAIAAGVILLLLIAALMITLAFMSGTDEVTNAFGAGKVDIALTETNWSPAAASNIVPGTILEKNPRIINNERTDVYVFLRVTVPYTNAVIESSEDGHKGEVSSDGTLDMPVYRFIDKDGNYNTGLDAAQNINPGWVLLEGYPRKQTDTKTYEYVYAHVFSNNSARMIPLMEGTATEYPLFDKIQLVNISDENFDRDRDYRVTVEAFGIQSQYLEENNTTTDVPERVWSKIRAS